LDFTLPDTALKPISLESSRENFSEIRKKHLGDAFWPGAQQAALRLPWSPFPAGLGKVNEEEIIENDGQPTNFLEWLKSFPRAEDDKELTYTKIPRVLKYGNGSDDEEELDFHPFQKAVPLKSLTMEEASSPVLELDSTNGTTLTKASSLNEDPLSDITKKRVQDLTAKQRPWKESILHNISTTATALSNFMFVNGNTARAATSTTVSPHFLKASIHRMADGKSSLPTSTQPKDTDPALKTNCFINIYLDPPANECTFIVSSTFFIQRHLMRRLQALYPSATPIERDLSSSLEDGIPDPNLENEADLLLSPSTGLLWTTLPSIQQKSLPNQKKARSSIRDRIAGVAMRYERLIVLVSSGLPSPRGHVDEPDSRSLNKYDSLALVDLMAFTQTLEDEIQVLYVPGGEAGLAQWMVKMMIKYRFDADVRILEDSTLWELFLRRAGMNAYAAQVILAMLKAPDESSPDPGRLFGLVAFVDMAANQRISMFERVMGGRKVLLRMNGVLDGVWR
jgi:hypothetical protein